MSRGTIMLTAGDEFGRTQKGNNNAYAQDNELTWIDWTGRDRALEGYAFALAAIRKAAPTLAETTFLTGDSVDGISDVAWLDETGQPLGTQQWIDPDRRRLSMMLVNGTVGAGRLAVIVNGDRRGLSFSLPLRDGFGWRVILPGKQKPGEDHWIVAGRTVVLAIEEASGETRGGR
jgi:glycogen operon protein